MHPPFRFSFKKGSNKVVQVKTGDGERLYFIKAGAGG
jgi:hypothetical protein